MIDQFGRTIDYMRISITDRCNLRCLYCMPVGCDTLTHEDILHFEEILRVCRAAVSLGITKFKITGGEPLVRKGCVSLIRALKQTPGVEQVTLTTNGLLLGEHLDALIDAGLDAVNISVDSLDPVRCRAIAGSAAADPEALLQLLRRCAASGLRTKTNSVLLPENREDLIPIASLAQTLPVDVRFIELMPIGFGGSLRRESPDEALLRLREVWSDLKETDEKRGNGPAHYYRSDALLGRIGFIDAVSHKFCASCNRVRLTSTGLLKPCLCFDAMLDVRALLRGGCDDEELTEALQSVIYQKPRAHCFDEQTRITERRLMSQIGG